MTVSQPGGPATRVREIDRPPDEALRLAAQAAKRVRERATPVRIEALDKNKDFAK